jgi:hypothetical protein
VINVGPLRETAERINPRRHRTGAGNRGETHVNRTILAATTLAAGLGLLAGGCAGSANGAVTKPGTSGTETISGTLKGAAAMTKQPVFHLTFRGPVNTTATYPLGTTPKKGHTHTFKTAAGNFVIVTGTSASTHKLLSPTTCRFEFMTTVPYTVSGSQSTGRFAGATGTGKAAVLFQGDLPKLKTGKCNESATAMPVESTVVVTFKAAGPLTLK